MCDSIFRDFNQYLEPSSKWVVLAIIVAPVFFYDVYLVVQIKRDGTEESRHPEQSKEWLQIPSMRIRVVKDIPSIMIHIVVHKSNIPRSRRFMIPDIHLLTLPIVIVESPDVFNFGSENMVIRSD